MDAGAPARYRRVTPPQSSAAREPVRPMLRRFYDWTIRLAASPRAVPALALIAFAESSFFPIPPDVILVPMSLANPKRAWFYAGVSTIASVLGGVLGYAIGALLYDTVGLWLITLYGMGEGVEAFKELYNKWGAAIILIKGVTPIPYKLVTIACGFTGYSFFWFVVLSLITRGARFYLLAGLLHRFGDPIRELLERRFGLMMGLLAGTIVGGVFLAKAVMP